MPVAAASTQLSLWPTLAASVTALSGKSSQTSAATDTSSSSSTGTTSSGATASTDSSTQTQAEKAKQALEVAQLKSTDQQVRSHEAAHLAAAGSLASGGAQFTYEAGPDGARYAVAGEVNISVSEGRTPEETLQRAEQIRRAPLAPADPSAQDLSVAAMAAEMEAKARQQIASEQVAAYSGQDQSNGTLVDTNA
jgi:hypothetical protein